MSLIHLMMTIGLTAPGQITATSPADAPAANAPVSGELASASPPDAAPPTVSPLTQPPAVEPPPLLDLTAAARQLAPAHVARLQQLDVKRLHELSKPEIAEYLQLSAPVIQQRRVPDSATFFARKAIEQPYHIGADLVRHQSGDCVSLVDRALAMSLATDWPSYFKLLMRLSHKDGLPGFLNSNFFTLGDWVPNNSWLLADVTQTFPSYHTFQEVIWRKDFYKHLDFGQDDTPRGQEKVAALAAKVAEAPVKQVLTVSYLSRDDLPAALAGIKAGDVLLVVREFKNKTFTWLDVDHMGIAAQDADGELALVHSARPKARLQKLSSFLKNYPAVKGFKVLRIRDDARMAAPLEMQRVQMTVPNPSP